MAPASNLKPGKGSQPGKQRKGPHARFDQVVEKIRFQVNVRDNSVSSNEGTQTLNQLGGLFHKTGTSAGAGGRPDGSNDPQRIQFDDEASQERARDYSSSHRFDKLKAGFNVSYDSNSFQGIKNNLIMQTKAG